MNYRKENKVTFGPTEVFVSKDVMNTCRLLTKSLQSKLMVKFTWNYCYDFPTSNLQYLFYITPKSKFAQNYISLSLQYIIATTLQKSDYTGVGDYINVMKMTFFLSREFPCFFVFVLFRSLIQIFFYNFFLVKKFLNKIFKRAVNFSL